MSPPSHERQIDSGHRFPLTATAAGLAVVAYMGAVIFPAHARVADAALDFRSQIWGATRSLVDGANPYDTSSAHLAAYGVNAPLSLHPPGILAVFAPLAALPPTPAYIAFTVISCALMFTSVRLLTPRRDARILAAAVTLLLLVTYPGQLMLQLGQVTSVALLGLALLWRHRDGHLGSLGMALFTVVPQTALPISIVLALAGYRRRVITGWLAAVLLSIPPVCLAIVDAGGLSRWWATVADGISFSSTNVNRIDVAGAIGLGPFAASAVLGVALALVLTILPAASRASATGMFVVTTVTTLLVYHQPYDLIVPAVLLLVMLTERPERSGVVAWHGYSAATVASLAWVLYPLTRWLGWRERTGLDVCLAAGCIALSVAAADAALRTRRGSSDPSAPCP